MALVVGVDLEDPRDNTPAASPLQLDNVLVELAIRSGSLEGADSDLCTNLVLCSIAQFLKRCLQRCGIVCDSSGLECLLAVFKTVVCINL